ncbi:hypothetical protein PTSG_12813 [Salpingoeca rosetta]|uniref:Kinesin-like protein n=1 Tax=Salpingoeca rosetta (strain ATCC 50818 / BSB-021) TaxID=946362 RepID=F2ULQ7_SALR5|nr:uncharacterized protein PTSG_12813 [Salpingoeca rosetta]EGD78056.1 hypothetical protein PTSG_12813 [Salpingoeca rosetta]|eukprot:XP_004989732.1 hypothetical protein PTSG_12813 [Salpingoeca rosetta]
MLEEYGLELGSKVDIQRSDGRVHGAVISSCNADTKTVSVQWVENNETKGKEIDFNTLVRINKLQRKTPQQQQQQKQQPQSISASSKKPLNPSSHNSPASQRPASPKKPSSAMGGRRQTNIKSSSVQQQPAAPFSVKERDHSNLSKADRKVAQMIDECRARFNPRPFSTAQAVYTDKITVCVRKRPLGKKENNNNEIDCITAPDGQLTVVHEPKEKVDLTKYIENHEFRFDYSFDEACDNAIVYKYTAAPLVRTIFDRGMATCFAYGQTGSGKTYTMGGLGSGVEGIYAMAAKDVFALNAQRGADQLTVSVSFFEIYGGKVYDLLNKQKRLRVLEDGKNQVRVVGLSEKVVETIGQVQELLAIGSRARATGTTSANAASSRSHAVLQIILREPQGRRKMHGQFSLIDLAGNERGADTASADRRTRMEGAEINKSLLALKECIRALGRRGAHTPFRASKLTQVLRDSFISPRARTCMIAMISPGRKSCEHTLNTLR